MRELKIDKILDMKFINQVIYPNEKIEELKEFVDFEPIVAEDDDWGKWHQNVVEWLLETLDVGEN